MIDEKLIAQVLRTAAKASIDSQRDANGVLTNLSGPSWEHAAIMCNVFNSVAEMFEKIAEAAEQQRAREFQTMAQMREALWRRSWSGHSA